MGLALLVVAEYNTTDFVIKLSLLLFRDVITVTAISQADSSQTAEIQIEVKVETTW